MASSKLCGVEVHPNSEALGTTLQQEQQHDRGQQRVHVEAIRSADRARQPCHHD
jgi:hypothetical protein